MMEANKIIWPRKRANLLNAIIPTSKENDSCESVDDKNKEIRRVWISLPKAPTTLTVIVWLPINKNE